MFYYLVIPSINGEICDGAFFTRSIDDINIECVIYEIFIVNSEIRKVSSL